MKYTHPPITSTSYSRLLDFESCPWKVKLKVIDKLQEPERPLPKGKTEHANDRGTRIHEACEAFVRGDGPLPPEAESYRGEFESLIGYYQQEKASLEGEWAFNRAWEPVEWNSKDAWVRIKADAVVWITPKHVVVIDYKTGRKHGNEIKHGEQVSLYGLAVALREPNVEIIDAELWYLDKDEITHARKPADRWVYQLKLFTNRFNKMTNAVEFKPTPSQFACQWCPWKDGICDHAYDEKVAKAGIYKREAVRRKGQ